MTQAEWNSCTDAGKMLEWLSHSGKATERKLRLFGCACVRRVCNLLTEERRREMIDIAEQYVDGRVERRMYEHVVHAARAAANTWDERCAWGTVMQAAVGHAVDAAASILTKQVRLLAARALALSVRADTARENERYDAPMMARHGAEAVNAYRAWQAESDKGLAAEQAAYLAEQAAQSELLRCLFFNPCRPGQVHRPSTLDTTVRALAQRAYADHHLPAGALDPVLLAALGDALEQAGCADREVLGHLRQEGAVHVPRSGFS